VIRFGTVLTVVLVSLGLLVGGVLANSLLLVYLAIGLAALAAVMLTAGAVIWRGDVFGDSSPRQTAGSASQAPALASAGSVASGTAGSHDDLASEQPPAARPQQPSRPPEPPAKPVGGQLGQDTAGQDTAGQGSAVSDTSAKRAGAAVADKPGQAAAVAGPDRAAVPPEPSMAEPDAAAEASGLAESSAVAEQVSGSHPAVSGSATEVTIVPGIARYHRGGCILIRFLGPEDLESMTIREAEQAGCVPCKACQPEQELADDR